MPAFTIKAPAYAASIGLTPRSILRFINVEKMPGARKVKGIWRIDAAQAEPWIREHHPRIFQGEAEPLPRHPSEPQSEDQPETEAEITDRHIQRLNHILDGMVTVLHDGTYNRDLVHSIKQVPSCGCSRSTGSRCGPPTPSW